MWSYLRPSLGWRTSRVLKLWNFRWNNVSPGYLPNFPNFERPKMLEKKQRRNLDVVFSPEFCDPWSFDMTGHEVHQEFTEVSCFSVFWMRCPKVPEMKQVPMNHLHPTQKVRQKIAFQGYRYFFRGRWKCEHVLVRWGKPTTIFLAPPPDKTEESMKNNITST